MVVTIMDHTTDPAASVATIRLTVDPDIDPGEGGSVVYRATIDGRMVGWVGDGRLWRGTGYGARYWWACHREDGDTAARWDSDLVHRSRAAAVRALDYQLTAELDDPRVW